MKPTNQTLKIESARSFSRIVVNEFRLNNPNLELQGCLKPTYPSSMQEVKLFHKEIPQIGEEITIGNYHFVIEEATNKKIELVKMTIKE